MSKDSQEGLNVSEPLLKVQRHLSVSQQTIHVGQTHGKHTKYTHTDRHVMTAGNKQGQRVPAREFNSGLKQFSTRKRKKA